jgi:hypothetical protein
MSLAAQSTHWHGRTFDKRRRGEACKPNPTTRIVNEEASMALSISKTLCPRSSGHLKAKKKKKNLLVNCCQIIDMLLPSSSGNPKTAACHVEKRSRRRTLQQLQEFRNQPGKARGKIGSLLGRSLP